MKAIVTKYHGATDTRGSRISAIAEGGHRVSVGYDSGLELIDNHAEAVRKLCAKLD